MALVEDSIAQRGNEWFENGMNSKVKLELYRTSGRIVQFKKYLYGPSDAGSRLMFKFRSGTHGLNEAPGEGRKKGMYALWR